MITNGGHGYFLRTRPCQINSQEAKISDVTSMARLSAHHLRPCRSIRGDYHLKILGDPKTFTAAVQATRLAQESLTVSASPSTVAAVSTPSLQELVQEQRKAIEDLRRQFETLQTSPPVVSTTTAPDITGQLCANVGHAARECRRYRQEVAAL